MKTLEEREYIKQGLTISEYTGIHIYLNKNFIKTGKCTKCSSITHKRTEWALNPGATYSLCIDDYTELCPSCHRRMDYKESTRKGVANRMREGFVSGKYESRLPKYTRGNHPTNRPVIKLDAITGDILNEYPSVTQACLGVAGKNNWRNSK